MKKNYQSLIKKVSALDSELKGSKFGFRKSTIMESKKIGFSHLNNNLDDYKEIKNSVEDIDLSFECRELAYQRVAVRNRRDY